MTVCVYGEFVPLYNYHCIISCAHLRNGTRHRTVTMVAPLLVTSYLVGYESVLHSYGTNLVSECVCEGGGANDLAPPC